MEGVRLHRKALDDTKLRVLRAASRQPVREKSKNVSEGGLMRVMSFVRWEWFPTLKLEVAPKSQLVIQLTKEKWELERGNQKSSYKIFQNALQEEAKKTYKVKLKLKYESKVMQQKRKRVPIQLQKSVVAEIKWLLIESHTEEIDKPKDDVFIQPTVITVKRADQFL